MPLVPFNPDLSITIKHPLLEGGKYSDYIELLYPEVEEQTRTIKFRVTVPNPNLLLQKGMFAQAEITLRRKDVLVVPETAVVFTGDSEFVFIFRDNKIVPRKIIIGQRYLESENSSENTFLIPYKLRYFEILEGLEEGDTIITSGTFLIDAESQLRKIITEETQDSQQTPHQHNH
jgi:Cu(I)/Ag(I) efflux system membrane fusion protein